ncbi:MAG: protein kinase [Candidatus Aminicenantes bacterium]|nr:MAG: protein kinase [Candidatus Aminicenantes bacterium]
MKCPKCQFDNPEDTLYCGKCATPLKSSEEIPASPTKTHEIPKEELTTGSTFAGRYQVIEELGKGGMGKVYRALDKKLNEEVALKLIKPEISSDKKTLERFSNELKLARKIAHKNIGKMYELMEDKGTHFITMEYVPGEDLRSMIRMSGQLGIGTSIRFAKQVCEGLSEAHRLGVVHRDLKPSNIMVDKEGNARIMDFGIARSLKAKGITGAGVMIGTPEYMSPEQVEGKDVDQRSDIYSFGVILYEMVTGRVPFEGATPFTIGVKHQSEHPKNPRELNTQIPEDLCNVILRCLEKDKENRFQSAGEVRSELENIEKGIPTTEKVVPKRKPITSREITVTFGLKKVFIPALVVLSFVLIAVVIWQPWSQKETVPVPSDKPSLVVMYFKNNTGDQSLDVWRTALSDSVITDLSQSKYIKVISGDRLYSILGQLNLLEAKNYSSEDLKRVASRGGVNHILLGNYSKAGVTFRIEIMIQDVSTGELIGSERVEGEGEKSIFAMVDGLTRRIKEIFKLSVQEIAGDLDREVGKITTNSPDAYKYYSEGRKYHNKGDNRKAIEFYKKAVEIDPEFAIAYRSLSATYSNLRYYAEDKKYLQKALEYADRVSVRERYLIQGEYYWIISEKDWNKSIEAFKKLLEIYPDDIDGNNVLGLLYEQLEEFDKAIEKFEVNFQNRVEFYYSYSNLAGVYRAKGLYDKAREVLEYYQNNISDNARVHRSLGFNYLVQGKYDRALVEVEKAFSLDPNNQNNFRLRGGIYNCRGDLIKAEKEYQEYQILLGEKESIDHLYLMWRLGSLYLLQGRFEESKNQYKKGIDLSRELNQAEWTSRCHIYLAYLHIKSGNLEDALRELYKAKRIADEEELLDLQKWIIFWEGFAYVKMKSLDEAQRLTNKLRELIEEGMNRKEIRYYSHLMGMTEFERENFSKSIEYLKKAISLIPYQSELIDEHAVFIEPLALVYYKRGDKDLAQKEYEKITSLTTGRFYYGDIYAKSIYILGKIFEEKGWKGKAIEHYEKFLDLWKNADPGIAEVEDARKRLVGLKGQ